MTISFETFVGAAFGFLILAAGVRLLVYQDWKAGLVLLGGAVILWLFKRMDNRTKVEATAELAKRPEEIDQAMRQAIALLNDVVRASGSLSTTIQRWEAAAERNATQPGGGWAEAIPAEYKDVTPPDYAGLLEEEN